VYTRPNAGYILNKAPISPPSYVPQQVDCINRFGQNLEYTQNYEINVVGDEESRLEEVRDNTNRSCKHYLLGYCERGSSCHFKHCPKDIDDLERTVFFCGLPSHVTKDELRKQLSDLGFSTEFVKIKLFKPWPLVQMGSAEEAKILLTKGTVYILGSLVRVRSQQTVAQNQIERVAEITNRSIFLGGIKRGITSKRVRLTLKQMGVKVVNFIRIKKGYCPKVTLATIVQAKMLIAMGKIRINGEMIDVRPYEPCSSVGPRDF